MSEYIWTQINLSSKKKAVEVSLLDLNKKSIVRLVEIKINEPKKGVKSLKLFIWYFEKNWNQVL